MFHHPFCDTYPFLETAENIRKASGNEFVPKRFDGVLQDHAIFEHRSHGVVANQCFSTLRVSKKQCTSVHAVGQKHPALFALFGAYMPRCPLRSLKTCTEGNNIIHLLLPAAPNGCSKCWVFWMSWLLRYGRMLLNHTPKGRGVQGQGRFARDHWTFASAQSSEPWKEPLPIKSPNGSPPFFLRHWEP